jgi:hypothetical protein
MHTWLSNMDELWHKILQRGYKICPKTFRPKRRPVKIVTWALVLGEADVEDVDQELWLVVVHIADVDGQVQIRLEVAATIVVIL